TATERGAAFLCSSCPKFFSWRLDVDLSVLDGDPINLLVIAEPRNAHERSAPHVELHPVTGADHVGPRHLASREQAPGVIAPVIDGEVTAPEVRHQHLAPARQGVAPHAALRDVRRSHVKTPLL